MRAALRGTSPQWSWANVGGALPEPTAGTSWLGKTVPQSRRWRWNWTASAADSVGDSWQEEGRRRGSVAVAQSGITLGQGRDHAHGRWGGPTLGESGYPCLLEDKCAASGLLFFLPRLWSTTRLFYKGCQICSRYMKWAKYRSPASNPSMLNCTSLIRGLRRELRSAPPAPSTHYF